MAADGTLGGRVAIVTGGARGIGRVYAWGWPGTAAASAITQEQGHGSGPFGAKGLGEAGILPVAAAIANAIDDAVGARVTVLPLTPERVLAAIDATRSNQSVPSDHH